VKTRHFIQVAVIGIALFSISPKPALTASPACTAHDPKATIVVVPKVDEDYNKGIATLIEEYLLGGFRRKAQEEYWVSMRELSAMAGFTQIQQQIGLSDSELSLSAGGEFALSLTFSRFTQSAGRIAGRLVSNQTGQVIRGFDQIVPDDDTVMFPVLDLLITTVTNGLGCDVDGVRLRPIRPLLSAITMEPVNVTPGGTIQVSVTLTDASDGSQQPGRTVQFENASPDGRLTSVEVDTDFFGVATATLDVGSVIGDGHGIVQAHFRGADGKLTDSPAAAYRVVAAVGDLGLAAAQAALRVGDNETVTATLQQPNGTPWPNQVIDFGASGGTVSSATSPTDSSGHATTGYQPPSGNGLVQVTATTTVPGSSAAALESVDTTRAPASTLNASLTFVVDGAVTLNLSAPDTIEGGSSQVIADLSIGGNTLPDTPITFTLTGPGALSESARNTDSVGRAQITYIAPSSAGSATVTATAVVDGQTYTKTVTIQVGAVGNQLNVTVLNSGITIVYVGTLNGSNRNLLTANSAPPISLATSFDGVSLQTTVSQPAGNTIAIDEVFSTATAGSTLLTQVGLSITAQSAGTLEIAFNSTLATSTGLCVGNYYAFDVGANQIFQASSGVSARVSMAAGETRVFYLLVGEFGQPCGSNASGNARLFTLTFR
jgi:hypothetical protein